MAELRYTTTDGQQVTVGQVENLLVTKDHPQDTAKILIQEVEATVVGCKLLADRCMIEAIRCWLEAEDCRLNSIRENVAQASAAA